MNGRLQQPKNLWNCMIMHSFDEAERLVDELQFDLKKKLNNGVMYSSPGEVLMLEFEGGIVSMVTYKTTFETNYTTCIDYAKEDLKYQIVIDDLNDDDHVLRFDGEKLTLFCLEMANHESISYSIRLLFKIGKGVSKASVTLHPYILV